MHLSDVVLVVLVLFLVADGEEKNTNTTSVISPSDHNVTNNNNNGNITKGMKEINVTTERILRPIVQPAQNKGDVKKLEEFKPSPLLETRYEFDRFVTPEAKFVNFKNKEGWPEKFPKEYDWNQVNFNNQIKFPQTVKSIAQTVSDHPYPFIRNNDNYNDYNDYNNNQKQDENIGLQPPIFGYLNHGENYQNPPVFAQAEKYEGYEEGRYKPEHTDLELQDQPYGLESHFPWKKVVKFLTTFVPIGILLSALIPNVISITPINNEQSRSRADEDETQAPMQLVYSSKLARDLKNKGCDHRILCELLLGAGYSRNPEENAGHLLETYVEKEEEIAEKTEELKRIMVAVDKGSCGQFKCTAFK